MVQQHLSVSCPSVAYLSWWVLRKTSLFLRRRLVTYQLPFFSAPGKAVWFSAQHRPVWLCPKCLVLYQHLPVFLLNSLPIAFDSLALKHRWKSFLHWSLVALVLFLVSPVFCVCSHVWSSFWCGKGNIRSSFYFSFWSFSISILKSTNAVFSFTLGACGGHWQLLLWEVGGCSSQHCPV